jgi:NAD(P)-dependent dehydrogenase (short-subunit alcohol dehydrogenase family)
VVLLTGGARGITAEVACELAGRNAPTLILAGRSPAPVADEPAATAAIEDPRALRSALAATAETPGAVERACRELLAARSIRRTLTAVRAAGATARYEQIDVRDAAALRTLVEGLYEQHGRLDGVIHGAGVIEDRRIDDKDPESFARVLATKAGGAFTLVRCLRPESLRFLVFFTSVAARFGNPGQVDYAAANGVLHGLAAHLDARWPARVVAVDWAPWAQVGMAAGGVADLLAERGISALTPAAGRRALLRELAGGTEPEVVLGDGPWAAEAIELAEAAR